MPNTDLQALLQPVSENEPCGPDLEYDQDFVDLEQTAKRVPEQELGTSQEKGKQKIAGKEPRWPEVEERAARLLQRTKHVRVAVILSRSLTNQAGLAGLRDGMLLVRGLLERYWDGIFPLEEEARANAVADVFDWDTLRLDLMERPWFAAPGAGAILLRDCAAVLGRYAARADAPLKSPEAMHQALGALPAEQKNSLLTCLRESQAAYTGLSQYLVEKLGTEHAPEGKELSQFLTALRNTFEPSLQVAGDMGPGLHPESLSDRTKAEQPRASLSRREDIARMLDQICEYLETHEPSNPAPLLLKRAKNLIGKSFMDIVEDIAPSGLDQVRNLAGGERK